METRHPWQSGPTELISHALEHLHQPGTFHQRMAYLLLDMGVETLLRTYLELPVQVTKVRMSSDRRQQAARGSFHDVVQTVASVAGPRVGGLDLGEIEVYRGLRSELYHRGRGMAIRTDQVQGYAELAVKLLLRLLQVDLAPQLMRPPPEIAREQQDATLLERIRHAQTDIATLAAAIGCDVRRVVEALEPSFLMPSFERDLKRWLKALDQGPLGSRLQKFHTGGGRPASDPSLARAVQQGMPAPLQRFLSVHPVDPVHLAIQLERAHSSTETLLVLVDSSVGLSEGRTAASTYWVAQLLQHEDSLGDWATRDRDRVPLADPLVAFRDRAQEAVADLEGIHSALQRRMKTLDT